MVKNATISIAWKGRLAWERENHGYPKITKTNQVAACQLAGQDGKIPIPFAWNKGKDGSGI